MAETFADSTRYVVVQRTGTDTLHINPREECNIDDADYVSTIDRATARSMALGISTKSNAEARYCRHCVTFQQIDELGSIPPVSRTVDVAEVTNPSEWELGEAADGVDSDIPYVLQENPEATAILRHEGHEYVVPVSDAPLRRGKR